MSSSDDSALLQEFQDLRTFYLTGVSAFAWLSYDILIEMEQEITHIWRAKLSAVKVLYIIVRYLSLLVLLLYVLVDTSYNVPESICRIFPAVSAAGIVVVGLAANIIQLLRVRALYNYARKVTIPLYILFVTIVVLAVTLSTVITSGASVTPQAAVVGGCLAQTSNKSSIAAWVADMILGGAFLGLTLAKLQPYLRSGAIDTPVLTVFVRDGIIFFVAIFAAELANAIFAQVATIPRPGLTGISPQYLLAVYGIAAPRLILHLRGIVSRPSYMTTVQTRGPDQSQEVELGSLPSENTETTLINAVHRGE